MKSGELEFTCFCENVSTHSTSHLCFAYALFSCTQLPWEDVKTEMVGEKGLEPSVADKIGEYVKLKGGMELVESLKADDALSKNKSAKTALEDMKLLLRYIELFDIRDKVGS